MRDPEFVQLRNRFLFGVLVVIVFAIPIGIFLFKTYGSSSILTKMNKKESFTILVVAKDCEKCSLVKEALENSNVKFIKLNRSMNKDYDEIMKKLNIENKREKFPIIVYVEDGKMKANLSSISSEEMVSNFVEFHGLNNM